jgi:hypothetical protein
MLCAGVIVYDGSIPSAGTNFNNYNQGGFMYSIAISYTDSRGNDKVRAFCSDATSEAEAIGAAFMDMADGRDAYVVTGWDAVADTDTLLAAIEAHVRAGKKIPAIKALREVKKWDLRKAKKFVDDHWYDWPRTVSND